MATENTQLIKEIIDNINKYIGNDKDCFKKYIKNNENYDGTIEVSDHNKGVPIRPVCKGDKISPGDNAFRTDIALFYGSKEDKEKKNREKEYNGEVYLVIIEVKGSGSSITTNDILDYSSRAKRHKNIYPWLRYGMVWSSPEKRSVPKKFYMNNESLDFAFNFEESVNNNFQDFYENILRKQIIISLKLHEILNGKTGTPYFSSNVDFGYKGKEDCKEIEGD